MSSTFVIPEAALRATAAKEGVTHFTTGIAIIRDGALLIVRRAAEDYMGGYYELPGGGVDDGESFAEAVQREAQEETGLTVCSIVQLLPGFDYSTPKKAHVRQINIVATVDEKPVVLAPDEHDEYQWIRDETVLATINMSEDMRRSVRNALACI